MAAVGAALAASPIRWEAWTKRGLCGFGAGERSCEVLVGSGGGVGGVLGFFLVEPARWVGVEVA